MPLKLIHRFKISNVKIASIKISSCIASVCLLLIVCSYAISTSAFGITAFGMAASRTLFSTPIFINQSTVAGLSYQHKTFSQAELNMMISGAAAGDYNRDGWVDLFVLGGGATADALFINQQNGTFVDESERWGVDANHRGSGVAAGDYDGDGWLDLYITSHGFTAEAYVGLHRLYRNVNGSGFVDMAESAGVRQTSPTAADGFGATFGDYDLDGDLDLFVAGWRPDRLGNRLFQNRGNGTFRDVTDHAGADGVGDILNNGLRGFAPCFSDMDGDRYPELLVAGDFDTTRYYVNNGDGTFTDQSTDAGMTIAINGMGSAVADLNNDGLQDWYVTSIYQSDEFGGDGNRLFMNEGAHRFSERGRAAGVDDGFWGWGTVAADLDHNGALDLVETNGWPLEAKFQNQSVRLWMNEGNATFLEQADSAGLALRHDGRGILNFDYDNDGDQDLLLTTNNGELALFSNELDKTQSAAWVRILLDTSGVHGLAPDGIGARVQVRSGSLTQIRYVQACSNFLSQSELSAHFGLANAARIDEIRVEWPNGQVSSLWHQTSNQTYTISPPTIYQHHLPLMAY